MFTPTDKAGECNARLVLADDHGENDATMRCQRLPGHEGRHTTAFTRPWNGNEVMITWTVDERADAEEAG